MPIFETPPCTPILSGRLPHLLFPGYKLLEDIVIWVRVRILSALEKKSQDKRAPWAYWMGSRGSVFEAPLPEKWPHQQNVVWRQCETAKAASMAGHGTLFLTPGIFAFFFATMAEARQTQPPAMRQTLCCCWL